LFFVGAIESVHDVLTPEIDGSQVLEEAAQSSVTVEGGGPFKSVCDGVGGPEKLVLRDDD
jgi:hypothetical protein